MSALMLPSDYEFYGLDPFDWQREEFLSHALDPYRALFSEPRCGKTKPVLDRSVFRFLLGPDHPGYVDLVVVIAMPSGAPLNWERVEVPKHVGDRVPLFCLTWDSADAAPRRDRKGRVVYGSERWRARLLDFENFRGLRFLFTHGESVLTESFLSFLRRVMPKCRVSVNVDESTLCIKAPPGPNGKRTQKVVTIGHQKTVVTKTIMDGTPYGEGPLDLFGQTQFLKKGLLGFDSFQLYQARYCEMGEQTNWKFDWGLDKGLARAAELGLSGVRAEEFARAMAVRMGGKVWQGKAKDEETRAVKYRNLDELHEKLKAFSVRVLRRDVYSSPAPTYQKIFFEMTPEQNRVFEELRATYEAELADGSRVEAKNVLERYMRLQQVSRNYYPSPKKIVACPSCQGDDDACPTCEGAGYIEGKDRDPPRRIDLFNPCLEALADDVKREFAPTVVWCRFHTDLDDVSAELKRLGMNPTEISGRVSSAEEKHARAHAYREGKFGSVVATPRSAGRAISLPCYRMYYYDHEYSLTSREQSQLRGELPGNTEGTGVMDLIGRGTKDMEVVDALIGKRRVADVLMGERTTGWL